MRRSAPVAGAAAVLFSAALTVVAGTGAAATGTAYVAMGDSYTSGPNIPTQSSAAGGCDRSSHDYPSDVAAALKLTLTDVSCSGATTANILNTTQDVSPGPDNPPQLSAVGSATQVISLQIGGDNLGFTSIIENCIALTPWGPTKVGTNCRNYYDPGGKNSLASDVTALAQPIATILADIHTAAPGAKVFVVGYPDILPQNGACWPSMPFETADAEYLNSIEQDLNSMLQETAAANGATFVDTYTPSEGHNACTAESTRWVEPIVPASPADPVHPNANGEAAMASELELAGI
ncbi:MAG: SGNH/GDSL hydrolase family protein [Acidimicrobiales bacterium]